MNPMATRLMSEWPMSSLSDSRRGSIGGQPTPNEVASRMLAGPKLPLVAADDADALATAVHCLGLEPPEQARIAWIQNTLSLSRLRMSTPLWEEVAANPALRQLGTAHQPQFDDGSLVDEFTPARDAPADGATNSS
jgi:hypothetical protein